MPRFEGQSVSVVLLGRHNPQILNHDFLLKHDVLPVREEPFASLLGSEVSQGFTEFVCTPVISSLRYGPISIVVEDGRFQIADQRFEQLGHTPILGITRRYFGGLLHHTPVRVGGINLNGIITFSDAADERAFDQKLALPVETLRKIVGVDDVRAGVAFSFPWKSGIVEAHLPKPKDREQPAPVIFNYEFKSDELSVLLAELDVLQPLSDLLIHCLRTWNVELGTVG